jgi:hypothetical protein
MPTADRNAELGTLEDWFRGFAEGAPSALYRRLSASVADEPDVMELLLEAAPPQRLPMLLFAAVHAEVLARGIAYPQDGPAFIAFCRENADALKPTLRRRSTQTNEVGRCAYLRPCIAAAADGRPLALVEVGASAGLNLNLDRYAYDFGGGVTGGDPASPLTIGTDLRRGTPPLELPPVGWRAGIDLSPAPDPDWLRACVFADQPERLARLDAALAIAREHPPELVQGDALAVLPEVLGRVPEGMQPVVFHTAVTVYLTEEQQRGLEALVAGVTHVNAERGRPEGGYALEVDGHPVGAAHPHGTWLEWTGR